MKYMIEGKDSGGQWTEDAAGNDSKANTFPTEARARAMIPRLVAMFADNDPPPTFRDFRVTER